jgi:multisubunit Na+/H+ antiporter MnhB subunit
LAPGAVHWVTLGLVLLAVAGLASAVLALPETGAGLSPLVEDNMPLRDLQNRVTLVLLDFRGYDTLLELGVLLLALVVIWSLTTAPDDSTGDAEPLLRGFVGVIGPIMVLLAGYLLWTGADAPGGAFQGGAVLGAVGVLLRLTGARLRGLIAGWPLRLTLVLGLLVFLAVAIGPMALGRRFLEYPPDQAKGLILLIETAAMISIGAILTSLYIGGRPGLAPRLRARPRQSPVPGAPAELPDPQASKETDS